jgi:hypothetical protein
MVATEFPGKNTKDITNDIEQIFNPAYGHLISSVKLNVDKQANDIDEAILKGLLKAKNKNFEVTIKLCLKWNRVDILKNYIFTEENKDKV